MLPYPLPVNGSQCLPPNGHLAHLQPDPLITPSTSLVGLSWDKEKLLCTPCEEQSQRPARSTKPPLWLTWTCPHCLHWTTNRGGPLEAIPHAVIKITPQSPTRPLFCFFFSFWSHYTAYVILVPQPGIEPGPSAVRVQSPNPWTAREFPCLVSFTIKF